RVGWGDYATNFAVTLTPSVYTLTDGTINAGVFVGQAGGRFVQNGGTIGDATRQLIVRGPAAAQARYELHAGNIAIGQVFVGWNESTVPLSVGSNYTGHGEFVQDGGSAVIEKLY